MKVSNSESVNMSDYIYVIIQFALLILFIVNVLPLSIDLPIAAGYAGIVLAILGIAEATAAIVQLRKQLSPFPTPLPDAKLIVRGIYKYVRHPIYGGIIAFILGIAFYTHSAGRIYIGFTLIALFYFKSSYEERKLQLKFQNYRDYKLKTFRFFPFFKLHK